jgi:hypothetical protein
MKRNGVNRLRAVGLLALAFLLSLNARADPTMPEESGAKFYGITVEQYKALVKHQEEIGREYDMALKSTEGVRKLQAIFRKAIANIDAASDPVTSDGNNLPASFTALFFPKQPKVDSNTLNVPVTVAMSKSGFMGLSPDNLLDQETILFAAGLTNTAPEILLPVLQERAHVFPPTAADYMLYGEIYDSLRDNNFDLVGADDTANLGPQVPRSRSVGLLKLAQAKNPIYRLLAVRAAEMVEPDETKRLNFYYAYLNETDLYILASAIDGVAKTTTPATISVLQSFQAAAQKNGNAKFADLIQEQIKRLKQ